MTERLLRLWATRAKPATDDSEHVAEVLAGFLPGNHTVEIELWYRRSDSARQRAQQDVTNLVAAGGEVLSTAEVSEIGYHGLKCTVPLDLLQQLSAGDFEQVALVKSAHVMYLRVRGQTFDLSDEVPQEDSEEAPADIKPQQWVTLFTALHR